MTKDITSFEPLSALDNIGVGVCILKLESRISNTFRIIYINKANSKITETDLQPYVGKIWDNFFSNSTPSSLNIEFLKALDYQEAIQIGDIKYNGDKIKKQSYHLEASPLDENTIMLITDSVLKPSKTITELETRNIYLNSAPDAMIVTDQNGEILMSNKQATILFGYSSEELLGKTVELLIPKRFKQPHKAHRVNYGQNPKRREMGMVSTELIAKRKDKSEFSVEISLNPINIGSQKMVAAAIRDVTEKKKMVNQLRNAMNKLEIQNAELEQFAYIASHDLQEPLRTIKGFTEILSNEYQEQLGTNADKYLSYISQVISNMSNLIKGLLDYSRIGQEKELIKIDCNALIKEILNDLASRISETKADIQIGKLPLLKGYELELRLLFQNLITNAIKFQKKGTNPQINITAEKKNKQWEFKFHDNGIGIANEHQNEIFVIFKRLHPKSEYEGTGIGLAHCRKIIELHGGKIWVDSQPNKGSTFYFTIPI